MSPELHASASFRDYQTAFAARLRDPFKAPRPPGAPAQRMKVYEELLYNNLESFLLACYPVTHSLLSERAWQRTVRRFFTEQRSPSPLFRDIPKAFLDWIEPLAAELFPRLPFLAEFMHYEWLELSVSITPEEIDAARIDPAGDLLRGRPVLNPSARLHCYSYPVHRISPRFRPHAPDPQPHCYLLFRDEHGEDDVVRFISLNPMSVRLLTLLRNHQPSGAEAIAHLAGQTAPAQHELFVQAGADLLNNLLAEGALLGTWRDS